MGEARIEEWLEKQDRNISHLLPEEYEEEAERTSNAATKTIKDNPRQWQLPGGTFYSNMVMEANMPNGNFLLVQGVDTPLISESKGTLTISPVRGVNGVIPMEKLIN